MRLLSITSRDKEYHGLLYEAKSKVCCIFLHGTASNFYEEKWIEVLANKLAESGVSLLSPNTSGSNAMNAYPKSGSIVEIFEDVLPDYDGWIKKLLSIGYRKIILIGHSLGTEKAVYYYNKTVYKDRIIGIVLAGFSDTFNYEMKWLSENNLHIKAFNEANKLVSENKDNFILTCHENIHAGVLPKAAKSFLNFFSDDSELKKCLDFTGDMNYYMNIKVPMVGVISDTDKYTVIPISHATRKLKQNKYFMETLTINKTDHDFTSKEHEVAYHLNNFVKNIKGD
jgi:hypothetical protein